MNLPVPIPEGAGSKASEAELARWRDGAADPAHVRHELEEHSDAASPLRRFLPHGPIARGLEIGIGPYGLGFLAVHLADAVRAIDGVDPLPRMELKIEADPALAKQVDEIRARVRYIQAAGERMPVDSAAYDIVSCINVVDHARDPVAILREANRVLRPGGLLVFGVSTLSALGRRLWHLRSRREPEAWIYRAHPHALRWEQGDALAGLVPGETLWMNRPGWLERCAGHGRMSFWIRRKREATS